MDEPDTADILPFRRKQLSAKAIDPTSDVFPLEIDPLFVGTNERFCRANLPQVRIAVLI